MTTRVACSPTRRLIQVTARSRPDGFVGNIDWSTIAPVAAVPTDSEWVAAWVSTPMTNSY